MPEDLVKALQIIVCHSEGPAGPSLDEALALTSHLDVPQEWIVKLLFGWEDYAKRYKRPLFKELNKKGPARFLSTRMLRMIKRTTEERSCTLCGLAVQPPRFTWHKECWQALEPHTSIGFTKVCRAELRKTVGHCRSCDKKTKSYQFDHIVPVALGGSNLPENIQLLCLDCHKQKTKEDMHAIRMNRQKLKLLSEPQ